MEKQINNIMNWFPFDRVQKIMKALEWNPYPFHEGEIREKVREMLEHAVEENVSSYYWGFKIEVDNEKGLLSLEFTPAKWEAYEEENEEEDFPFFRIESHDIRKDKTLRTL